MRGESAGVEPDIDVPASVVAGLAGDGIDVRGYAPRQVTAERLTTAAHIVSFGCDLRGMIGASTPVLEWDDLPMVSDGYDAARDAIVARVTAFVSGAQ